MTRTMLVIPPLVTNKGDLKKSAQNLGMLYLGSHLKNAGHEVALLDATFEGWDNVRKEGATTTEYGLSDEAIVKRAAAFNPEAIGLTLLATASYEAFREMTKLLKEAFPSTPIIAGGAHATALPEKTLRDAKGAIDYLVLGEGERPFGKIIENLRAPEKIAEIDGVAMLDGGRYRATPRGELIGNLDSVGDLALELFDGIPFTKEPTYAGSAGGRKYLDVMLSRGCPLNCGFCFTPQMWERKFRKHSLEWIARQLDRAQTAGYGHIIVQDDNFSRGGEWANGVMELFKEKGLTWENNGGLEMEHLTPELVDYMADTNCTTLFIPLNLRTEQTDAIPENIRDHYELILRSAKARGLYVYTSHIMGFPEQTVGGMRRQADFARHLVDEGLSDFHVLYAFSVLPGTQRFHQIMEPTGDGEYRVRPESGIEFDGGWQNWAKYSINTPQIGTPNICIDEMKRLYPAMIRYINGAKADAWFGGREWPK